MSWYESTRAELADSVERQDRRIAELEAQLAAERNRSERLGRDLRTANETASAFRRGQSTPRGQRGQSQRGQIRYRSGPITGYR
jgi:predicted RNase H-like nuclease (RuvC/YqgF family)